MLSENEHASTYENDISVNKNVDRFYPFTGHEGP